MSGSLKEPGLTADAEQTKFIIENMNKIITNFLDIELSLSKYAKNRTIKQNKNNRFYLLI
jgi:hypothetical protein